MILMVFLDLAFLINILTDRQGLLAREEESRCTGQKRKARQFRHRNCFEIGERRGLGPHDEGINNGEEQEITRLTRAETWVVVGGGREDNQQLTCSERSSERRKESACYARTGR